jgi:hypothetical protein
MNNEPVAWIKQNPETLEAELHFDKPAKYWATVVSNPDIPLYTYPVKELTEKNSYEVVFDGEKYTTKLVELKTDVKEVMRINSDGSGSMIPRGNVIHSVKELTDEDYKEALACLKFALDDTMDYLTLNNLSGENNHWLVWARAILRKAQEK